MNAQMAATAVLGLVVLVLAGAVFYQSGEISDLQDQMARMEAAGVDTTPRKIGGPVSTAVEAKDGKVAKISPQAMNRPQVRQYIETNSRNDDWLSDDSLMDKLEENDPEVRERFRAMVREEQEIMRAERRQERMTRWAETQNENLKELQEKAGLTDEQRESLEMYMEEERNTMSGLWQNREAHSWKEMREKSIAARETTQQKASDLLDDDQLKAFNEMRDENTPRFMRRMTRDRDGRRGRGGDSNQGGNATPAR